MDSSEFFNWIRDIIRRVFVTEPMIRKRRQMALLRFSGDDVIVFFFFVLLSCLASPTEVEEEKEEEDWTSPSLDHGGVQMGIPDDNCDNAQWNLELDWDFTTDYEYRCQPGEQQIRVKKTIARVSCLDNDDIPPAIHECMTTPITYKDIPPRGGSHRPLWPIYGEYLYVPPQRWVHSLEHGAVVFLYHPCANRDGIGLLKEIARLCLHRHIITPYRKLPRDQPFAIVTYGCKLTFSRINVEKVIQFIKENALNPKRASEYSVWQNGQYSFHLVRPAGVVPGSDVEDSKICPGLSEADTDVFQSNL